MSKITKQTMDQQNTERVVDQDYPLEHVPKSARKSLLSISCVLVGYTNHGFRSLFRSCIQI